MKTGVSFGSSGCSKRWQRKPRPFNPFIRVLSATDFVSARTARTHTNLWVDYRFRLHAQLRCTGMDLAVITSDVVAVQAAINVRGFLLAAVADGRLSCKDFAEDAVSSFW
jgi:hypothetical protein